MAKQKRRTLRKRGRSKRRRRVLHTKGGSSEERTYVFLIPYRARAPQEKRRDELEKGLTSIRDSFTKYGKLYKMYVVEQDNDHPFNIGMLKNIGFLEAEKENKSPRIYIHFNTDYVIDSSIDFPKELEEFDGNGILDIFTWAASQRIGGGCCFNSETFRAINGFPNTMFGYGPDDVAFKARVDKMQIPHITSEALHNVWIKVQDNVERNLSRADKQLELIDKDDLATNGLSTCNYVINGPGEFDTPTSNIHHLLADFEFTES